MVHHFFKTGCILSLIFSTLFMLSGCSKREKITKIQQLEGKEFAVPTGTVVDRLILSKFPKAKFQYFNNSIDAALAVKAGKADAAADDAPVLKNIAAKNSGLTLLPELITHDNYGFAVQPGNRELKGTIDFVVSELRKNGKYDVMLKRWLPDTGNPGPMPDIPLTGTKGVLKLGTSSISEPFVFVDGTQNIVGLDIELSRLIAQKLDMKLEVINMDFGALIAALVSGKVDMIAGCITITDERAKKILFSEPYYSSGIAALVRN